MNVVEIALLSYLMGSIPFSYIIPKLKGIDIRKVGSGNVGATNVSRALGAYYALLCGALDVAKAYLACYLASIYGASVPVAGLFAMLGHVFSVFLGFRAGKGVSTFFGFLLFVDWKIALILLGMAAVGIAETKIVSINSLSVAIWAPMLLAIFGHIESALAAVAMAALIFYTHKENVKRLAQGRELRIGGR